MEFLKLKDGIIYGIFIWKFYRILYQVEDLVGIFAENLMRKIVYYTEKREIYLNELRKINGILYERTAEKMESV